MRQVYHFLCLLKYLCLLLGLLMFGAVPGLRADTPAPARGADRRPGALPLRRLSTDPPPLRRQAPGHRMGHSKRHNLYRSGPALS